MGVPDTEHHRMGTAGHGKTHAPQSSKCSQQERVNQALLVNSGLYPQSVKRRLEGSVLESSVDFQGREQGFVKLRLTDPHRTL